MNMNKLVALFKHDAAGGVLLIIAAALALIIVNSPLEGLYATLKSVPVVVSVGDFEIAKPILLWVNDGLMAVFFFLVGLELKREMLEGELSKPENIALPALGAIGGIVVPVGIYWLFNFGNEHNIVGWAIPAATDIAFALGVLMLLGNRVPIGLKVFLVSLAIFDDVGAIIIIALFYTSNLTATMLAVALSCIPFLWLLNRKNVVYLPPYFFLGLIMWAAVLKSGVHATLAGVALAFFIPLRDKNDPSHSPVRNLEHELHGLVAYITLPLFAFMNAGIPFKGMTIDSLLHPVPIGIALGLFIGKPLGIMVFCYLGKLLGIAKLPNHVNYWQLFGASILCGIGFTMSLFVGTLAFEEGTTLSLFDERIGILSGSFLAAIVGYLVLNKVLPKEEDFEDDPDVEVFPHRKTKPVAH